MDGEDERRLVLMLLELAGDLTQGKGLRLLHLNWMDKMSQGCKGKAPLPFQLIPTAHLIHLNLPFPPSIPNGHLRSD